MRTMALVLLVLGCGIAVHHRVHSGPLSAFDAIDAFDAASLSRFLARGTAVDVRDDQGESLLAIAAARRNVEAAGLLLDAGADPNAADPRGWRPLHFAAMMNDLRMVRLLLSRGADVNARAWRGLTPLTMALQSGNGDLARLLLAAGAVPAADQRTAIGCRTRCPVDAHRGGDWSPAILPRLSACPPVS